MFGCKMKLTEILDSETQISQILGTFDLVAIKVNLWSFGALVSKWAVT